MVRPLVPPTLSRFPWRKYRPGWRSWHFSEPTDRADDVSSSVKSGLTVAHAEVRKSPKADLAAPNGNVLPSAFNLYQVLG
jgi:hypothetical protein